jgi:ribonuclease HII
MPASTRTKRRPAVSPSKTPKRLPKRARRTRTKAPSKTPILSPAAQLRKRELTLYQSGEATCIVGCDEAGRGPLAGPVVAAACYIPADIDVDAAGLGDVHDSKAVKKEDRERMYDLLINHPFIEFGVSSVSAKEIDEVNILQASMLAMHRATKNLIQKKNAAQPDYVFIDGNRAPWGHSEAVRPNGTVRKADPTMPLSIKTCDPVIKGDSKIFCIAAASIIAKVTRDRIMAELDQSYPGYNLSQHQGYPVASHVRAIHKMGGISPVHRLTFRPIKGSKWKVLSKFK